MFLREINDVDCDVAHLVLLLLLLLRLLLLNHLRPCCCQGALATSPLCRVSPGWTTALAVQNRRTGYLDYPDNQVSVDEQRR